MKRISFLLCSALLAGCFGGSTTLQYRADISVEDASKIPVLFESIERVLTRRFAAVGVTDQKLTVVPQDQSSAEVTIELGKEESERVLHIFEDAFTFDIRLDAGPLDGDPKFATWESLGIDHTMLLWVQAIGNRVTSQVDVELTLNEEGKKKLRELATTHRGKRVGIFVRDLLISALTVQSGSFTDRIIISGIPSAEIAEVFADDVNIGLHVRFTPL